MQCESSCVSNCESYGRQLFIMSHSFTNMFTHVAQGLTQKDLTKGTKIHTAGSKTALCSLVQCFVEVTQFDAVPLYNSYVHAL